MVAENQMIPMADNILGIGERKTGFGRGYRHSMPSRRKDRRKSYYDRRKGVRDGVIVTLSFKTDRRRSPDRRFEVSGAGVPTNQPGGSGCDIIA